MIKQIATAICLLACIAPALADDEKDKETHAETPSSVLQSLPAEVQKHIEDTRAECRAYWNRHGIADPSDLWPLLVSSGDEGLISFTLSGARAVIVSDLHLCGDQCIKSVTCSTAGGSSFDIYVRTGNAWRNVLSTTASGPEFLSLDFGTHPPSGPWSLAFPVTARTVRSAACSSEPMALQPGSCNAM
jgi:hypothetical protein